MPANFLFTNKAIMVCMVLQFSTSSSPPTMLVRLKLGSTAVVNNTAVTVAGSMSSKGVSYCYTVQGTAAAGASVSVEAGYLSGPQINASATLFNQVAQPVSGIATNGQLTVQLSAQWGTATSGNTVRLQQFYVVELN
jgi:hypothetical protein